MSAAQKNVENIYPLAPAQQGMLFHSLYEPESRAYVTQVVCRCLIDDVACFERAWEQVVQRHSILRSAMLWENLARPMQAVGRRVTVPIAQADWRALGEVDRAQALKALLEEDRRRGFKLSRAPLMRLALQQLGPRDYQFVWTFHHILLDGWSVPLVFSDLLACYTAARGGERATLPPTRPYADYIAWLQQQDVVQAEKHWKELLTGFGGSSDLGIPTTRKLDAAGASGSARAQLSEAETTAIQTLAQDRHLTLGTIVHAAWALVLSQYSGEPDIVFGTTVSGRPASLAGVESMVGVFINVLPARLTLESRQTVAAALEGLQRQLIRSTDFQHTPLLDVQRWSGFGPRQSLFDTVIAFENYPVSKDEAGAAGSLRLRMVQAFEKTNYPISVIATPGRQLTLSVLYDTGLFDATDMERLAARYRNAVLWIAGNMDRPISHATLVDAAERQLVATRWNETARDYPTDLCLHELVERQVRRTPDAPALRLGRTELSYVELNARANQLARFLRARGVGPEVLVGICLQRSLDLIVAMLAVLKAGGAYVPIDPDLPEGRLAFMLDDSDVSVLLTHSAFLEKLGSPAMPTFCIDAASALWNELSNLDLPPAASSDNLAYAIYTSGSTGRPKGAMNAHRGIVNRILWMQDEYGLAATDRMLQKAPFSFDVSLWEIFWPLSVGALVVVAPPGSQRHAEELVDIITEQGVTTAHFVPSMLQLFLEASDVERCQSLTLVFSGGEPLTVALQNALFARLSARLFNQYGPTETAVDVTWWPCIRESDQTVPIGRPSANVQLYVLDQRLEPVPVGIQGELHVGGVQVGRGYLNRAALTAERFIPDPFSAEQGARLYRTGDVVRQRPDGNIEYLGRIDHQVKIRGNRIELGEIEKRIVQHPAVKDAVVAAREDQPGNRRLVCYAVCGSVQPTTSELRRFVADALPDYMVPSAFVFLDALPRFLSGKIDRRALPAPAADRPNLEQAFAPPQTDVEEKLAGVWEEVLRVDRVGVHDNFFELGGDSILSLQIVWKANQRGIRLTPRELFEHPTIAELAAVAVAAVPAPAKQGPVIGQVPLTPIAHRFFERRLAVPSHFNQAVLLEVRKPVNESVFRSAASTLVEHHDALRLIARQDGSRWTQEIAHADEMPLSFELVNLAGLARATQDSRINEAGARLQAGLDLAKGPIVRFAFFDLGPRRAPRLLIVVHHLAIDVVSWRVLIDDLESICGQLVSGTAIELPPRTTPFRHWAEQLASYACSPELGAEAAYWLRAPSTPQIGLPLDRAEGMAENTTARTRSVVVELSARETKALLQQIPKAYGGDVPDVLLTAAARIIGKWAGSSTVVFDLEGHGREPITDDLDLSRTVGWFTTAYPVALEAGHDRDLGDALRSVKESLRAIPRKGIGYGLLRYLAPDPGVAAQLAAHPQPQVSFNYLGRSEDVAPSARLLTSVDAAIGQASSPQNARAHLLEINAVVRHGRLSAEWRYCDAVHDAATVEALATRFMDTVRQIVTHCASCRTRVFTPSDFPLSRIGQRILDELQTRYRREGLEDVFTASSSQQGILYHAMTSTTPGMYVTQVTWQLRGWLNRPAFKQAWHQIVDRHPILRAAFVSADEPHAIVCKRVRMPWREVDWRELTPAERVERFYQFIDEDKRQGFDLQQPPLLRSALFRLEDEVYQFVWTIHHSIMDGWSLPLVLQDVFTAYDATCSGRDPAFQPRRPFRDYIAWLQRRDLATAESYWRRTLGDVVAPTPLPAGAVQPGAEPSGLHASASAVISGDAVARLQQFARAHDLTMNTVVQGAWAALLARHAREREVIYGTTVAGRPGDLPGADSMIGVFINTLPMRVHMTDASLADWLRAIQRQQTAMREHEHSPLAQVQKWSGVGRGLPLFESIVVFENYPTPVDKQPSRTGLEIHGLSGFERVNYPLALTARSGKDLSLQVHYDCDSYRPEDAAGLLDQVCELLNAMPLSADRPVADLPILGAEARERILGVWSRGDAVELADSTIVRAFERHARVAPASTAVELGDTRLTYAELHARASAIAGALRECGLARGGRVAVFSERSVEMVAAFLGILKAGGVYVPVDPSYPAARVAFMLSDAGVAVTLTQASLAPALAELRAATPGAAERVVLLESIGPAESGLDSQTSPAAEDAAYLIYTSGSTGQPKGVVLEHRGLANVAAEQQRRFAAGPGDRVLQFSSPSFDASVFDFSMALASGATLVLAPRHDLVPGPVLLELLRAQRISVLTIPPSALAALPTGDLPDLGVIAAAGEPCPAHLVDRWADRRRFFNLYGPTEATIWTTAVECVSGRTPTIGRPIANVSTYVLDRRLNPVPPGMAGELYIGGRGVARGYLGRASLTAERFVPDPFSADRTAKLYKTGDIVRFTRDGEIEFVGRADQQVKVRGFRIEPGEVEAVLRRHAAVAEAAVVARLDTGDRRLVGYVVTRTAATVTELTQHLKASLPPYMVPEAFVFLPALPLTLNGKLDVAALPAPGEDRPNLDGAFVGPRSPIEDMLAVIWSELLGIGQVGVHDNFFDLGGHSLLATRLIARIRDAFAIDLPLRNVFETPTVAEIAERVAVLRSGGQSDAPSVAPIARAQRSGPLPLSLAQRRLWFLSRFGARQYHVAAVMRLAGPLDVPALERAIGELVRRHESLRTTFPSLDGGPVQLVGSGEGCGLEVVDLRGVPSESREAVCAEQLLEMRRRAFDLEAGPLFRASLVRLADDTNVLALVMHHIVADAWSISVMWRELGALYTAFSRGESSPLSDPELQYADYAAWQQEWVQSAAVDSQLAFWRGELAGAATLHLPTDRPRPPVQTFNGSRTTALYGTDLIDRLKGLSRERGATLFMTLLAAFAVLLHRYADQDDIVVGTPTAGRGRTEVESLVGFFINTLVLRTDVSGDPTFIDLLERVKRATLDGFAHQEVPFDRLVEALHPERDPSRNPLFQVAFALQNAPHEPLRLPGIALAAEPQQGETTRFDIELHLVENARGLAAVCSYNTDLYDASTIGRFLEHYRVVLEGIAANPGRRVDRLPLMTEVERREVLAAGATALTGSLPLKAVHDTFAENARRAPDAIAVSSVGLHCTYQDLDRRANQLAHHLIEGGVSSGDLVGIYLDRSIEMLVSIVAILKAGAAYVPLDPVYPADRLAFMLRDAGVSIVVSTSSIASGLPHPAGRALDVVCLDRDSAVIASRPATAPDSRVGMDAPAYVIYTSGSTGRPKGVVVTHGNVARLFEQTDRWFGFGPHDVWTLFHSYAFDFSVWEMWGALLYGGRLVVVPYEISRSPSAFHELLRRERVTVLNQTPSAFRQLIDADAAAGTTPPLALRWVVFGGEALDPQTLQPWFARHGDTQPQLVNMYGITETTVHVTFRPLSLADGASTRSMIGRPIPDLELYVLDRHGVPAPLGVPGELYVGGAGVARGYLNRPELTAERFVSHPFASGSGARLYKTGDLARRLANGDVEYLGRADHQVKIRGFRIELGEIESVLTGHAAVREAVVTRREDRAGDARLVAYLVPDAQAAAPVVHQLRLEREGLADGVRPYELPNGLVVFHRNKNETDFLYREIFGDASYLRHGIDLPEDACVFDVGANTGLFTVFVRSMCPTATVFAFEPIPPVFDVLSLNARLHGEDRVHVFACGLSDRPGEAEFSYYPHLSIMSGRFADTASERGVIKAFLGTQQASDDGALRVDTLDEMLADRLELQRVSCRLRTVSDIVREHSVERIDLLKVDVEKSELEVLQGIDEDDWLKIRQVVVEVHDFDGRLSLITELLGRRGFSVSIEQDASLQGTGLHNVYARRASMAARPLPAAAAIHVMPTWQSERAIVEDARALVKRSLPEYMIPSAFVVLDALPMTPSGKLDRQALPAPERRTDRDVVAPTSDLECGIAEIWREVLDVDAIGAHDNFFDLGGHSLLLARVHELLGERLGLRLSIVDLFRHPTVNSLAVRAEQADGSQAAPRGADDDDRADQLKAGRERLRRRLDQGRQVVKA